MLQFRFTTQSSLQLKSESSKHCQQGENSEWVNSKHTQFHYHHICWIVVAVFGWLGWEHVHKLVIMFEWLFFIFDYHLEIAFAFRHTTTNTLTLVDLRTVMNDTQEEVFELLGKVRLSLRISHNQHFRDVIFCDQNEARERREGWRPAIGTVVQFSQSEQAGLTHCFDFIGRAARRGDN